MKHDVGSTLRGVDDMNEFKIVVTGHREIDGVFYYIVRQTGPFELPHTSMVEAIVIDTFYELVK